MKIERPLLEGRFVRRYKRFFADIDLPGLGVTPVHCPNSGSMLGLDVPGMPALVSDSQDDARKLRYTLERVKIAKAWVGVNTMLPNKIVREGIIDGAIAELSGYTEARPEVVCGEGSRIDLLLSAPDRPRAWVEVKNTTLKDGNLARFPDSVTERGRKHLNELMRLHREGDRAVIFFLVNRGDCDAMGTADAIDPAYGETLRLAEASGVEILAYTAQHSRAVSRIGKRLPVQLR